jgi:hypothetical protein
MQVTGLVEGKLTRSKIVAKSLSLFAEMIAKDCEDLTVGSVEEAYEELINLGLAGNSERERHSIARAMEFEQAKARRGSLDRYEMVVKQSINGERLGLDNYKLAQVKSREISRMYQSGAASNTRPDRDEIPDLSLGVGKAGGKSELSKWREEELERIEVAAQTMIKMGESVEQVEKCRQAGLAKLDERELEYKAKMDEDMKLKIELAKKNLLEQQANREPGDNIQAHNKEEALAVLQREADKRSMSGILTKKEIEAWLAKETAKVNEAYDKLLNNQPTSN